MSRPQLIYFRGRGRAEVIRLLLAEADVSYEDRRIPLEEWPHMKSNYPFGELPVFVIEGQAFAEPSAILRLCARKYGLAPADILADARCDMICEAVENINQNVLCKIYSEFSSEAEKERAKLELPEWLRSFHTMLGANEYFVGDQLTYADIAVFWLLSELEPALIMDCIESFPRLCEFKKRIASRPRIAGWLARRPHTIF